MKTFARSRTVGLGLGAGLGLVAGLGLGTVLGPPAAFAAGAVRYFVEGGTIFMWDGVSATLGRAGADLAPPGSVVRDVLEAESNTLVVVGMSSAETSHGRHRHEGAARVYDTSVTPARLLRTIGYEGEPLDGVLSTNLRKAWILAYRAPDQPGAQARTYIHAIDLGTGRIEATSEPGDTVTAIAVDAEGGRLYASQRDRIQTFGMQPLVASWHLRSPGQNGPLALVPGSAIVIVVRGSDLAIFDPAVNGAKDAAERRARSDDATSVVHLPFQPDHLTLSDDGRLALVSGPGTMVFVDPGTGAMTWPDDTLVGLHDAAAVHALAFPGPGRDLIAALLPSGAVSAVRTPPQMRKALAPEPPIAAAPATGATTPATPPAAEPPAAPAGAPPVAAAPAKDTPAASQPAQTPAAEPAAEAPKPPALLSGKVTGAAARVRAIVLYGPNNILKEYARIKPEADGTWSAPLPPAGAYRVILEGDGSTPLPVSPGYIALKVEPGVGHTGLDFEVKPSP